MTLHYGNYGVLLIMGNAGCISSTLPPDFAAQVILRRGLLTGFIEVKKPPLLRHSKIRRMRIPTIARRSNLSIPAFPDIEVPG